MTIRPKRSYRVTRLAIALIAAAVPASHLTSPASAWDIVYDPSNYGQNVLQAARALEQINNQITSL
ncbi:MAG: trbJ, partial [Microvirga sp.]|nr:trbJ [Microvirga sp.]